MGLSIIQKSRLPLTEGGFSCGYALTRGMARHPSKPKKLLIIPIKNGLRCTGHNQSGIFLSKHDSKCRSTLR
ncbi:hypothetical protein SynBIOSE41_02421 [Synechococcus sp. BIOS-E4-1]|nr:hypothetical protein SynBIOSE41_02421 [Synechococcus sp. BIOS-E4-1]